MSLQLPEMGAPAPDAGPPGLPGLPPGIPAGPPPQLPQDLQDQHDGDPLGCLQAVLDDFPKLLTELQDPKDVQDAVKALHVLTGIQSRLMQQGGAGGAQAG